MPNIENRLKRSANMLHMSDGFEIFRKGQIVARVKGFFCNESYPKTVQFLGDIDVRVSDLFLHISSGHKYQVVKTTPITFNNHTTDWLAEFEVDL